MPEEEFEILAEKLLAGEASAEEKMHLDRLMAQDAALRHKMRDLALARTVLKQIGPLAEAVNAAPVAIPETRLRELQDFVRQSRKLERTQQKKAQWWPWIRNPTALAWPARIGFAALAVAILVGAWYQFRPDKVPLSVGQNQWDRQPIGYLITAQGNPEVRRGGATLAPNPTRALFSGDEIRLAKEEAAYLFTLKGIFSFNGPTNISADHPSLQPGVTLRSSPGATLQKGLFQPGRQLLALGFFVTTRNSRSIALYSPRESTATLTPIILWKDEIGKTYELLITDELDKAAPPFRATGVTSPVKFAEIEFWKGRPLSMDSLYRIRLMETGNPLSTSEYTFRTLSDAAAYVATPEIPAEKIVRAQRLLTSENPCPGDALAELLTLPSEFATSEVVLRLKLVLFGQFGLKEEYDFTAENLRQLMATSVRTGRSDLR